MVENRKMRIVPNSKHSQFQILVELWRGKRGTNSAGSRCNCSLADLSSVSRKKCVEFTYGGCCGDADSGSRRDS